MRRDQPAGLAELAAAVTRARVPKLEEVYFERRAESLWRLASGRVVAREASLHEGAAVRRDGRLVSGDGLNRPVLADLLGIGSRTLPPFSVPPFPEPPSVEEVLGAPHAGWTGVRWRWSWSAVLRGRTAVTATRPQLAEVTLAGGQRALFCWPPEAAALPGPPAIPTAGAARPGKARVLLAPGAANVLLHELVGHPLEGDLLLDGGSPWSGRIGERIVRLALSVTDDPTRLDLPGGFSADDEGTPAASRPLLAAGFLAGVLADRRCAERLGVEPGSARRAGVHSPPRPRISNLIATATDPLPEPPRADAAIEVLAFASGTLEPASGMLMFRVRTAFSLSRGKRRHVLPPFTLVGTADAVSRGLLAAAEPSDRGAEPGWCAKDGEVVPTGGLAPWLLLEGLEVR